jgi:thiol:disulfide interchange protein
MKRVIALWVVAVAACGGCALAGAAPNSAGPYDPSLDGWKQLQSAAQNASAEKRRVLVIVGGNWCKWCRALDRLLGENAELRDEVAAHFELVHLNWSKENRNGKAMKRLGNPEELGFPSFVILSPKLEVLHAQDSGSFENPDHDTPGHDPAKLLAFLKQWETAK